MKRSKSFSMVGAIFILFVALALGPAVYADTKAAEKTTDEKAKKTPESVKKTVKKTPKSTKKRTGKKPTFMLKRKQVRKVGKAKASTDRMLLPNIRITRFFGPYVCTNIE